MNELSLAVVGIDYPNADRSNRRFEAALCPPGEIVHLVPEPKNKHDRLAVAVLSARGVQLGYLTAERCGLISARLAAGQDHHAIFQELQPHAAIIRVRFGGGPPTLPPPPQRNERVEDDFDAPMYEGDDWGC